MEEDEEQQQLQSQEQGTLFLCPSFNSYTSHGFAEIATKVSEELSRDTEFRAEEVSNKVEDDDDFEFALVPSDTYENGHKIFYDGQFRSNFPIFDRSLLTRDGQNRDSRSDVRLAQRNQLKSLFAKEREERESPSCSSSESDDLEGVPPGTYCVWRPKSEERSPIIRKKSDSAGSASKRWKFLDLLRRSNSDGKERENGGDSVNGRVKANGVAVAGCEKSSSLAREVLYVKNRALNEDGKRKYFIPYREGVHLDSVNGLNKSVY